MVAATYRRLADRRPRATERRIYVRTAVEPEVVEDLVELVRRVRGRAALLGNGTVSVPVPHGVADTVAYRELQALLETWERRHPGVRAEISTSQKLVSN